MTLKTNARHAADDGTINEMKNPCDVLREAIANANFDRQEYVNPESCSVRYAWRERRIANRLLRKAIKRWFYLLPCRLWWHSSEPIYRIGIGADVKMCRRCGAWRGDY